MLLPALMIVCVLLGGWSFLSVLGNERQRQVQARDLERQRAAAAEAAGTAAAPAAASEAPVGREVAR